MLSEAEIRNLVRSVVDEATGDCSGTQGSAGSQGSTGSQCRSVAIGADHGGFPLKQTLTSFLREQGYTVHDCGTNSSDPVDYPDLAHAVARLVSDGTCRWGIIIDGAGIGSAMVANKVPGVRAALCYDVSSARNSREHNLANVLTIGAGLIGENLARQVVNEWLSTPWGSGRHARRVEKIMEVERQYLHRRGE